MMDIVYPMVNLSCNRDDFELKYSLRSWDSQIWVNNIYLIGHKPNWINEKVIHIPCESPYTNSKDANIINKILVACSIENISSIFVLCSDDQYVLKAVDPDHLVPMIENPSRMSIYKQKMKFNNWHRRVLSTAAWCNTHGYPDHIFQAHTPYLINKRNYPLFMSNVAWGHDNGFTTHIYMNMSVCKSPEKEPIGRTIRIKDHSDKEEFKKYIHTAIFLNHDDKGLMPLVQEYLINRFPNKSRWEI